MQAQVVHGLSSAEYHAHPAISKSHLDIVTRSPFHYHAQYLDKAAPEREETTAMKMGTLAHCAILEPDQLEQRYIILPDNFDKRTKEGKEWLAKAPPHKIPITNDQNVAAYKMWESLQRLPDVASALASGRAEASVFYTDPQLGLDLKIRPDWVHDCGDDGVILLDVKTTSDVSPREFARSVVKWRYHVQAAFYSDIYSKATGRTVHDFVFAVVESSYPFAAACYVLSEAAMRKGRALYQEDLQLLKFCFEKDAWPAFGDGVQLLELPEWATNLYD